MSPAPPAGWYLVALSRELAARRPLAAQLPGLPLALFRDLEGRARALPARCPHLGAHLASGSVVEGRLRCPLHAWEFDAEGACRLTPGRALPRDAALRPLATRETHGAIFVEAPGGPSAAVSGGAANAEPPIAAAFPVFESVLEGDVRLRPSRPALVRCPWDAVLANAFDTAHLAAVHGRTLLEPPVLERLGRAGFRLRYTARVSGRGTGDRLVARLSGGRVDCAITAWGGSLVTVESRLGRRTALALLGLSPAGGATLVRPLLGAARSALDAAVAAWLFRRFLGKDLGALAGMELAPGALGSEDEPLRAFLDYLGELPRLAVVESPARVRQLQG